METLKGLGHVRENEFKQSLEVLGIGMENGLLVDHPDLEDNMTLRWDSDVILSVVTPFIREHGIRTILTFDSYGISGHPNHISLSVAMNALIAKEGSSKPPRLFHLVSRNRILKFTGLWTIPIARLLSPSQHFTITGREGYLQALLAMRQYRSQLVWFRYLYLIFSRYMYINEWVEWAAG